MEGQLRYQLHDAHVSKTQNEQHDLEGTTYVKSGFPAILGKMELPCLRVSCMPPCGHNFTLDIFSFIGILFYRRTRLLWMVYYVNAWPMCC